MNRRLAFSFLLAACVLPAFAAKQVTVPQLEQAIAALHGKSDVDQAWQIASLELTQRLTPAGLASLRSALPGDKARQALLVVSDRSQFLDPPASEIPATAPPDLTR
ncbi:MAG TPA: hypothetical protein VFE01_09255 [Terracidiphilus sp.]|jgi:hypothetical protein|nr:hypothetical protein [Terracidiphilus sp.]